LRTKQLSRDDFARPRTPFRVKNPSFPGGGYDNTDFLYDSFSVAQAAAFPQMTPMFQAPISAAKTRAQTNMRTNGTLANGEVFKLRRMRVIISSNTYPADALNILQLCRASLYVGGREFIMGPVLAFPGGGGGILTAAAQVGTAAAGSNIQTGYCNGVPDIRNAFAFEDDIELQNNEQIQVDIVAETAFNMTAAAAGGVGTTIYVFLDGRRLRKVS